MFDLRGCCGGGGLSLRACALRKMWAHVALEIEVSKLILLVELKKLTELGISANNAPVLRVLKLVLTNVGIDLARHLRACHLSAVRLTEEGSQLLADLRRLHETAGCAVSSLSLTFLARLERILQLAFRTLLKGANLRRNSSKLAAESSKMGEQLRKILCEGWGCRWRRGGSSHNGLRNWRLRLRLGRFLDLSDLSDLRAGGLRFLNHYTL